METGDVGGRSKIEGRDGRQLASAFKGCAPSELRRLDFGEVLKAGGDSEDESEVRVKQSIDNRSCTEMYGVTRCDT